MKDIAELLFPEDVRYTRDHEWARPAGGVLRVGITDFAQDRLGDVVYLDLPAVGAAFEQGQAFGTVESVKAVSELFLPVAGRIVAVNGELDPEPQRVNEDPYGAGWVVEVQPADAAAWGGLLSAEQYRELLEAEA